MLLPEYPDIELISSTKNSATVNESNSAVTVIEDLVEYLLD